MSLLNTSTDVLTSVARDGVNCVVGTYMVDIVLYQTSNDARTNILVEVTVDGISTGTRGANGYIRDSSGHNEATTTVTDLVQLASAGKIGFGFGQLGATGNTVTIPLGESSMIITRMKD
jgi:ethanolamine utilization protein EutQ (cupin superfamily)